MVNRFKNGVTTISNQDTNSYSKQDRDLTKTKKG